MALSSRVRFTHQKYINVTIYLYCILFIAIFNVVVYGARR